jgi:integrase/recombinase XerC
VTVHQLRHTCASDLLENGTSLPEVQGILGHACIQSTCRYIHIAGPERKAAMALHPINSILGPDTSQEVING